MTVRRWLSVSLVAMGLGHATQALAAEDGETLLHQGVELRKEGRNAEALALFRRANELAPSARARAQIALAEQSLGHWVQAEQGLLEALSHAEDPWIVRFVDPLTKALETTRDHLGSLEIDTNVDGAAVSVDGASVGTSPLSEPLRVEAATHVIRVEAQGHAVQRRIDVTARRDAKAVVFVVPERPASSGALASGSRESPARDLSPPRDRAPASTASPSGSSTLLPTIALIGGGALVATGVVAQIIREANAAAYNDDSRCLYGMKSREERCGVYRERANAAEIVAISGYAVGGAALLTGAWLLLFGGGHEQGPDDSLKLRASVLPGTAYVSCAGAF